MKHFIVTYTVEYQSLEHANNEDEAKAYALISHRGGGTVVGVIDVQDVTRDYNKAVKP